MSAARRRTLIAAAIVVMVLILLSSRACGGDDPDTTAGVGTVREVIDGDTIDVSLPDGTETVRLLGVDTPETKHPTEPVECFGVEASHELEELLPPGTEVELRRDAEARDRYGRLLAYVYRADDDLFVNQELVAKGFAVVLVIPPNGALAAPLREAEQAARSEGLGLWDACGGADTPAGP
jgi:micrococcal nuclease